MQSPPTATARRLFRTSDARIVAQPVMSEGGTLFVGDSSGMFHAIQTGETGAWPTVNQNAQRTGQATGEYALPGEVLKEVTVHPSNLEVRSLDQTPGDVAEAMISVSGSRIVASQAGWFEIKTLYDEEEIVEREEVRVLSVPIQRFFVSEEVPIPEDANIDLTPRGPSVYKLNTDGSHEETEIVPLLWWTEQ